MSKCCEVIRDLLPLYADQICSEDTCILIENHLRECPQCREILEKLRYGPQEVSEERIKETELAHRIMKKARRKVWLRSITALVLTLLIVCFAVLTINEIAARNTFPRRWSYTGIDMQITAGKIAKLLKNGETEQLLDTYLDTDVLYRQHQSVVQRLDAAESEGTDKAYNQIVKPEEIRIYSENMLAMGEDGYVAFCRQTLQQAFDLFAEENIVITKYNTSMQENNLYISMQLRDDSGDTAYADLDHKENIYVLCIEYEQGTIQDISGYAESGELMKRFVKEKGIGFEDVPAPANPWRHAYIVSGIIY